MKTVLIAVSMLFVAVPSFGLGSSYGYWLRGQEVCAQFTRNAAKLAAGCAAHAAPFRIHQGDIFLKSLDGREPLLIRCPECRGRFEPRAPRITDLPGKACPACTSGWINVGMLGRPVVVVADTEPADYGRE